MVKKQKFEGVESAEERILNAARKVFTQKGYAGTRTRDIAEAAEINLALLNYYYRSKERLFEMVMIEKMQKLFGVIAPILNNEAMPVEQKIEQLVANYIDMLFENPDLPLFVLSEIRNNPEQFANRFEIGVLIRESHFVKQLIERKPGIHPLQFILSLLGMTIFPFVSRPVFQSSGSFNQEGFTALMQERKLLIPKWVKLMLEED